MFGGLAFLVGGHMAVAAAGQVGLMVRCDPADSDRLLTDTARAGSRWAAAPWTAGSGAHS